MKNLLLSCLALAVAVQIGLTAAHAQNLAGDMALSKVLIEGEDWQMVAEGYQFTDALCADAEGNLYFADVAKGTNVFRLGLDGKVTPFLGNAPKVSGLKFGPDVRLYACQGGLKRLISFDVKSGEIAVLATNVQPNDLVVSHQGLVYFTETGKGQVIVVDPKTSSVQVGASGINAPNGITLSPDQGTLVVSEYKGTNVWAFRVEADGSLAHGSRYMELRTPTDKPDSGGDGSTTDAQGRYYVTSHVGIQMFDATGRLGGVIAKPVNKGCGSVAFAGAGHQYLYVAASDKIFRRKLQAKGVLFFKPPPKD